MKNEVESIQNSQQKGRSIIPEISYNTLKKERVSNSEIAKIRHRGCVIVHGVFEEKQASDWNDEIGLYIKENDYLKKNA